MRVMPHFAELTRELDKVDTRKLTMFCTNGILWQEDLLPGGELPYEEYMGVCHELGSYFQEKIPKRVCQFFTKIPERAIISVRNSR